MLRISWLETLANNMSHLTMNKEIEEKVVHEEDPLEVFMRYMTKPLENSIKDNTSNNSPNNNNDNARYLYTKRRKIENIDDTHCYLPFRNNTYIEAKEVSDMTEEEVTAVRSRQGIQVFGTRCPRPIHSFSHCHLSQAIYDILLQNKYLKMMPVQSQVIPALMSGRDILCLAYTGSGKTMSYVLPIFRHIAAQPPLTGESEVQVLVVCPTRELCAGIYWEFLKFSRSLGLQATHVYGGVPIRSQLTDLARGPTHILVCTPGRMTDILERSDYKVDLSRLSFVVIEEADRLLDMGFQEQLSLLFSHIPSSAQVAIFSSSFSPSVSQFSSRTLHDPLAIVIEPAVFVDLVDQRVEMMEVMNEDDDDDGEEEEVENKRFTRLLEILREHVGVVQGDIGIFVNSKEACEQLTDRLQYHGYTQAIALNNGPYIHQLPTPPEGSKSNEYDPFGWIGWNTHADDLPPVPVLAVTPYRRHFDQVSYRMPNPDSSINHLHTKYKPDGHASIVINYHPPPDIEAYIGRLGTGWTNKRVVYTFVTLSPSPSSSSASAAALLVKVLRATRQHHQISPQLLHLASRV